MNDIEKYKNIDYEVLKLVAKSIYDVKLPDNENMFLLSYGKEDIKKYYDTAKKFYTMLKEYIKFVKYAVTGQPSSFNPLELMTNFTSIFFNNVLSYQQDAHEFLISFIRFSEVLDINIFEIGYKSSLLCGKTVIDKTSLINENILEITLDDIKNKTEKEIGDLDLNLTEIIKDEMISLVEYNCKDAMMCKKDCYEDGIFLENKNIDVAKKKELINMPKILIVHIDIMYADYINNKATKVSLPIIIPMTSFSINEKNKYNLIGLTCHVGNISLTNGIINTGGHYIAYIKNYINGKRYFCSDENTYIVDESEIEKSV